MRTSLTLIAVAGVFALGFVVGADNENRTHALKVASLTGSSYIRLVSPLAVLAPATLHQDLDDSPAGEEGAQG